METNTSTIKKSTPINIALIRGDSLNPWEGKLWESLPSEFLVHGVVSNKGLYPVDQLSYSYTRLPSRTDNRFVRQLNTFGLGRFQHLAGLSDLLIKQNIHVAHTAEIFYDYTLQAVRSKKILPNLKVVVTVWDNSFGRFDSNYWPNGNVPKWWREKMYRIIKEVVDGADHFLPVTNYSAQMLKLYGVPDEKMTILFPALYPQQKDSSNGVGEYFQHNFGITIEHKKVFVAVNRLVKEKGIFDIAYAWKMFKDQSAQPDAICLFIGKGPEEKKLRRILQELGITDSCHIVGSVPNTLVRQLLPSSRALLLASVPTPTWQEQFGYVLAEAIENQCPVIAADSGAIPEVVGEAGILFPSGNPVALAQALQEMSTQTVHAHYQEKCRAVGEKFSANRFARELASVYHSVLL